MKTIAGCIVQNSEGQYLLVEERQERVRGLWNIPAGYADEDETSVEAAIRETKDEVGLDVEVDMEPFYVYENTEKQKQYMAYRVTKFSGDVVVQNSELLSAQWLDFSAIVTMHDNGLIRDEWIFEALKRANNENTRH